jgi:acetyl esterase/lipase
VRGAATLLLTFVLACGSEPGAAPTSAARIARDPVPSASAQAGINYAGAQTLDFYAPKRGKKPFPLILRLNGSAQGPAADAMLEGGYALAVVRYRTDAPFPAGARDVKAAVRFLRAKAARYEIDPNRFIAWGWADGGWFAVMLGVTGDQATAFDDPSLGNAQTSSAVQYVVDMAGATDFLTIDRDFAGHPPVSCVETYQRHTYAGSPEARWVCGDPGIALSDASCVSAATSANLIQYVATAKTLPEFFVAHGPDDCTISWWQSVQLVEALKKREQLPTLVNLSRSSHDDVRFETTETAHALKTIESPPVKPTE